MPLRARLGHIVRALRADAGFSQERFSALVKVHRTFMGSLERGRANPSLETLERLARGLRMTAWELLKIAETNRAGAGTYVIGRTTAGRSSATSSTLKSNDSRPTSGCS
ncbi:MAG: helix-turn-helix domain-containing protein [Gemmatimonadales bacterium]